VTPPLSTEEQRQASEAFEELVELAPAERAARLAALSARVRGEVESLLAAGEAAEGFLETPLLQARRLGAGQRLGVWQLQEVLGQGGMSVVHHAERMEGGYRQRAAIKLIALPALLPEELQRQILNRFESERQIIAKLEHPNICRLLDGGISAEGVPYLVLEYVEGVDLVTYGSRQPMRERVRLMADVARVVHFAHQRLLVHRDLKPSNILVTAEGSVKLLDFGIAKPLDPGEWGLPGDQTATLFRAATPAYASPEQMKGEAVTTAADLYSLGRVWHELAGTEADEDLRAITAKATREEPEQRYESAAEMALDLERWLSGLPVAARQGTWQYLAGKFIRRNRVAVSGGTLAALLLLAFAVVTYQQKRQVEQERQRAETVAGFLRGLFRASDPEQNQGNRVTTRELLDAGARRIRESQVDEGTRLNLLETMAEAYFGLGLYEKANALFAELAQGHAVRGEAVRASSAYGFLAEGQSQRGQAAEAITSGEKAVTLARGQAPGVLADALEHQCLALHQASKVAAAVAACREAAGLLPASRLGSQERARILRSYGMTLGDSNEYAGAEKAYQESLSLARSDGQATTIAETLEALGSLYFRQGRFPDSEQAFREALTLQRKLYPDGHAKLARTLNNLANTVGSLKRFDEAGAAYREAHALYAKFLGEDSRELLVSISNYAVAQQAAGDLNAAGETLRFLKDKQLQLAGKESLTYQRVLVKLASVRLEQERYAEAAELAREAVAGLDKQMPPPRIERGFGRVILAAAQVELARGREGLETARAGRELLAGVIKPTHWMSHFAEAAVGVALVGAGQKGEARRTLEPLQALFEKNRAGGWRAEWVRRWTKRAQQ
jgi:tetratricopeptide (TPR) repeat protein/DNA-binding transcriptional ArsR family regulator